MSITWIKSNYDIPDTDNERSELAIHANEATEKNFRAMVNELVGSTHWAAIYCAQKDNVWAPDWKHKHIIGLFRPAAFKLGVTFSSYRERDPDGTLRWAVGAPIDPSGLKVLDRGDIVDLPALVDRVMGSGSWKAQHQAVTRGQPKRLDGIWAPVARAIEVKLSHYL